MKKVFLAVYESIKKNLLWVAFFSIPFLFLQKIRRRFSSSER